MNSESLRIVGFLLGGFLLGVIATVGIGVFILDVGTPASTEIVPPPSPPTATTLPTTVTTESQTTTVSKKITIRPEDEIGNRKGRIDKGLIGNESIVDRGSRRDLPVATPTRYRFQV